MMHYRYRAALLFISFFSFPVILLGQEETGFDVRLFRHINNQQSEKDAMVEFIDQSSFSLFIAVPAGLLFYGAVADDRSVFDTGVLMGMSQMLTLGTVELGKFVIDRPRPFEVLQNVKLKHESSAVGSSFPSGHTSQAFAIATMLAYRTKPVVFIPAIVWATFVGYGRIYIGVHYPTDVIAGLVVGMLMSSLVHEFRHDVIDLKNRVLNTSPEQMSRITTPLLKLQIPIAFR